MEKLDRWDIMYIDMVKRVAKESKCAAKQVGCLLVRDNNILAIGINGTFPKAENCNEKFKKKHGIWWKSSQESKGGIGYTRWIKCLDQDEHHKWSLINEVHAEMNAVAKVHKNGVSIEGATAYITHSPCFNCAKELYVHGIKRIIYLEEYDDINEVKKLLKNFDVEFIKYEEIKGDII